METLTNYYAVHPNFWASQEKPVILPSGNEKPIKRDGDNFSSKILHGETYWSQDTRDFGDMMTYFDKFYANAFKNCTSLAVDGPSCCGKSTLIDTFKPLKINQFYNVQTANAYNIFPTSALSYIHINDEFNAHYNLISDRSAISNVCYLIAYYVMNCITNNLKPDKSLHGICQDAVDLHNLKSLFSYLKSRNYNILIIMDSSYRHTKRRMIARGKATGSSSDLAKALIPQYHTAQIASFSFVANILNLLCLDFHYIRRSFKIKDDSLMFKANYEAFTKHNTLTNQGIVMKLPIESTTSGTDFFKTLQGIAIDLSSR